MGSMGFHHTKIPVKFLTLKMELTALQDPLWETPLLTAAHLGNLKLVRILLEAGAQRQGISVEVSVPETENDLGISGYPLVN